jgi:hypothetical protein
MAVSYSKKDMFVNTLKQLVNGIFQNRRISIEESERWQQNGEIRKKVYVFNARLN